MKSVLKTGFAHHGRTDPPNALQRIVEASGVSEFAIRENSRLIVEMLIEDRKEGREDA